MTLSIQDNAKLFEKLKSGFKKQLTKININENIIIKTKNIFRLLN